MNKEKDKSRIEVLSENINREKLLIASGAVFRELSKHKQPVSSVAIAMRLQIAVPLVNQTLAKLLVDKLVTLDFQGHWQVAF